MKIPTTTPKKADMYLLYMHCVDHVKYDIGLTCFTSMNITTRICANTLVRQQITPFITRTVSLKGHGVALRNYSNARSISTKQVLFPYPSLETYIDYCVVRIAGRRVGALVSHHRLRKLLLKRFIPMGCQDSQPFHRLMVYSEG